MHQEAPIYLDYNATTPLLPEVVCAMLPVMTSHFGNPSSGHAFGRDAKRAVDVAREHVARLLRCQATEVVFMSCATETINFALKGAFHHARRSGIAQPHIITSAIEHVAVGETCRFLESEGARVTYLNVDSEGFVSEQSLREALCEQTVMVSLMLANNEIGTIQDIQTLCRTVKEFNTDVLFHTDASQAIGKIDVDVQDMGVDLLTVAGHKLYAPKGVGALFVRSGCRDKLDKLVHGAGHEGGTRAGTENTILVAGFGEACRVALDTQAQCTTHLRLCKSALLETICERLCPQAQDNMRVNGPRDDTRCLPNTLSLSFRGLNGSLLMARIQPVVAASAGSACHEGRVSLSHVLRAVGVSDEWGSCTLRLSVGKPTTLQEVTRAGVCVAEAVNELHA